jgi:hypothetical protein
MSKKKIKELTENQKATMEKIEAHVKRVGYKMPVGSNTLFMMKQEVGEEWCNQWLEEEKEEQCRHGNRMGCIICDEQESNDENV